MKPYLITVGEPAGIGPDCIIRAFSESPDAFQDCIITAPASWLQQRADEINLQLNIREFTSLHETCSDHTGSDLLRCWNPHAELCGATITPGLPSAATAKAVIAYIETATRTCLKQDASALITGPIEKAILKSEGFQFPGHTEFLAHISEQMQGSSEFVMMLASDQLRVALLTTHIALSEVPQALTIETTVDTLRIVDSDLKQRFKISQPRIGLCGLNPHAGEQGHFGREEIDILIPAKQIAAKEGIHVMGPLPADTLFSASNRKNFDAIVCCYHDQALIPIKTLSFGDAVNVTLGLPFVRTSVDHGTALDLVGKQGVSSSSLLAAIAMAKAMANS